MAGASQSDSSLHYYLVAFQTVTSSSMGCDPFFEKAGAKVLLFSELSDD